MAFHAPTCATFVGFGPNWLLKSNSAEQVTLDAGCKDEYAADEVPTLQRVEFASRQARLGAVRANQGDLAPVKVFSVRQNYLIIIPRMSDN